MLYVEAVSFLCKIFDFWLPCSSHSTVGVAWENTTFMLTLNPFWKAQHNYKAAFDLWKQTVFLIEESEAHKWEWRSKGKFNFLQQIFFDLIAVQETSTAFPCRACQSNRCHLAKNVHKPFTNMLLLYNFFVLFYLYLKISVNCSLPYFMAKKEQEYEKWNKETCFDRKLLLLLHRK